MTARDIDLGWWQWEAGDGPLGIMRHVHSGERLVHRGAVTPEALGAAMPPDLQGAELQRIDYQHPDLTYPLVVAITPDFARLVLDHNASAALWRAETGSAEYPAYGPFCRVDDAALEALRIWPSDRRQEDGQGQLISHGGWFNGRWQRGLKRTTFTFSQDVVRWALDTRRAGPIDPAPPPLAPLDAKPEEWSFKHEQRSGPTVQDGRAVESSQERFEFNNKLHKLDVPLEDTFYARSASRALFESPFTFEQRHIPWFRLQLDQDVRFSFPVAKVHDGDLFLDEFDFAQPKWWDRKTANVELPAESYNCRSLKDFPGADGPVNDYVSSPLQVQNSPFFIWELDLWRPGWGRERHELAWRMEELLSKKPGPPAFRDPAYCESARISQLLFHENWVDANINRTYSNIRDETRTGNGWYAATVSPMASRMMWREVAAALTVSPFEASIVDRFFPQRCAEKATGTPRAIYLSNWHWIGNFYPHLHIRQGDGSSVEQVFDFTKQSKQIEPRIREFKSNHLKIEGWD